MSKPTVIDLFCGAGGLSLGFQDAGFRVIAGADINPVFGSTFTSIHNGAEFIEGPIANLKGGTLSHKFGLSPKDLDVLVGGPPCQGYSVYNHKRGMHDPRASLFEDYLSIVSELKPKWLVMENVTGLLSIENGRLLDRIKSEIRTLGYLQVEHFVVKAEEYGVPQERRRVLIVANRIGIPISMPSGKFGSCKPFVTVWDAIGDLPPIWDEQVNASVKYVGAPQNSFQVEMRGNRAIVAQHHAPKLGIANRERLKHIPAGGSWRNIPFDLLPEGMKKAKRSDHTKRYGRPNKDDLSCTLLTKCDIHWGAYIHPVQNRPFSVREYARLQSFPDHVEFNGSMTEQFMQIGNAVPPRLARAVAGYLLHCLEPNETRQCA
jgi:DNA (cytosine-5)-methyltransferase 1